MPRKTTAIPVNHFGDEHDTGISIERMSVKDYPGLHEKDQSERHDRHGFFWVEKGSLSIEIDFQTYHIKAPAVLYMHPSQVHRGLTLRNVVVCSLAIRDEQLNPEYLKLLEGISPVKPLPLKKEAVPMMNEAASLCLKFAERTRGALDQALLRDSANLLAALVISLYLERPAPGDKGSRADIIAKTFHGLLERHYVTVKSPAAYAKKLNLSTAYLNECVKQATGHSVSHQIQQRVTLEAKRLLYHSDRSVKEIATELGFDDYPYFSRLFTKVTGMTALSFRSKNRE